jgi:hypothetical protein
VQRYVFEYRGPESFRDEIAPARTFGFVHEFTRLAAAGLAAGGRLDNCVLIGEDGVVNGELRFPDEFVRHKILDVMGDFTLLGRPLRGRITARATGHRHKRGDGAGAAGRGVAVRVDSPGSRADLETTAEPNRAAAPTLFLRTRRYSTVTLFARLRG